MLFPSSLRFSNGVSNFRNVLRLATPILSFFLFFSNLNASTDRDSLDQFRKIFLSQVSQGTQSILISEDPAQSLGDQLIFFPASQMQSDFIGRSFGEVGGEVGGGESGEGTLSEGIGFLNVLAQQTSTLRSIHLFEQGLGHSQSSSLSLQTLSETDLQVRKLLRTHPVTLIIVPGIFGEFIRTRAFEEVFEQGELHSTFAKEWQNKLNQYENQNGPVYQPSYSLEKYSVFLEKIQNLVSVASIDDFDGTPLVKVVLFKTAPFSLETLGTLEDRASQFNSRLNAAYRILGDSSFQNTTLVGYSRGTTIALEMLAQAKQQSNGFHWLKNVRGLVSLGGVTFGSALADKSLPQLAEVESLAYSLKPLQTVNEVNETMSFFEKTKTTTDNAAIIASNHLTFAANIKNYAIHGYELSPAIPKTDLKTTKQNLSQISLGNIKAIIGQVLNVFDFSLETISLRVVSQYNENVRKHNTNVIRYNGNIARFQMFVAQTVQAARELSTEARLQWWKNRSLPLEGIHYYSIAGTMSEPNASATENGLAQSPAGFSFGSPDDNGLLQNFRDLRDYSGEHLNDSQVAINRVRFWPELIGSLRSENKGIQTQFLGVLGTHHWGLALRIVTDTKDGKINPFPRIALLKALSGAVAQNIANSAAKEIETSGANSDRGAIHYQ